MSDDFGDFNYDEFNFQENDDDMQGFKDDIPEFIADEPEMKATFGELLEKHVFGEELDPRSQKDKPYIALRNALLQLGQDPTYIDDAIREMRMVPSFPTLNAVYLANARLYLSSGNAVNSSSIKKWVDNKNNQFGKDYLDTVDFFRYLIIGGKIFK